MYTSRPDSLTFGRKAKLEKTPKNIAEKAASSFLYAKLYLDSKKTRGLSTRHWIYSLSVHGPYEENLLQVCTKCS